MVRKTKPKKSLFKTKSTPNAFRKFCVYVERGPGRSRFRAYATRKIEEEFLRLFPAHRNLPKLNLNTLHKDRCHRMSSGAFKDVLAAYANGKVSAPEISDLIEAVIFDYQPDVKKWNKMKANFHSTVAAGLKGVSTQAQAVRATQSTEAVVNKVFDLLFTTPLNTSIADRPTNQSIGELNDLNFTRSAATQNLFSLTPRSRRILEAQNKNSSLQPGFRKAGHQSDAVKSSHVPGHVVPKGSMSPKSKRAVSQQKAY